MESMKKMLKKSLEQFVRGSLFNFVRFHGRIFEEVTITVSERIIGRNAGEISEEVFYVIPVS